MKTEINIDSIRKVHGMLPLKTDRDAYIRDLLEWALGDGGDEPQLSWYGLDDEKKK